MKWLDAEQERAEACDAAFQNGGPRVYVYDGWKQHPSSHSAAATIRFSEPGEVVYSRRKMGQRWVWRKWVVA